MEDWLVADWTGVLDLLDESRVTSFLHLGGDGRYKDVVRQPDGTESVIQGSWTYESAKQILHFQPDAEALQRDPPVALGLAACDLRYQPAARGKAGRATAWMVTNHAGALGLMCLDPPKLLAPNLYYRRLPAPAPKRADVAPERIVRWADDFLGELSWDGLSYSCEGQLPFQGRTVRLDLWLIEGAPTAEEFQTLINMWRELPERLPAAEPALRRQAAERLAEAVLDYGAENGLPREEFLENLELLLIRLSNDGEGELRYISPKFFGIQPITISCDVDLSFQEVEVG